MNLLELRAAHPDRFYTNQTWFVGESFMRALPNEQYDSPPLILLRPGHLPRQGTRLPLAVELAHCFVQWPDAGIWASYLWCADTDSHGQRVFVGVNAGRFEIHRHLNVDGRWGCPAWH